MSLSTPLSLTPRFFTALLLSVVIAGLGTIALSPKTAGAQNTYTVGQQGDADDANPGDGTCATSGGGCTLRAAIQEANASTTGDDIEFDLDTTAGFATIVPDEQFRITESVTIDGTTQNEYPSSVDGPVIILDGSDLSNSADDGIEVDAADVTIRGLAINSFPDEGIQVFSSGDNVTIEDCFVGIAADDGRTDAGNGTNPDDSKDAGITLSGDDFTLFNNVISHNNGDGVYIDAGASSGGIAVVQGNLIGLGAEGETRAPNFEAGARLAGGSGVTFGAFARNYVSGNDAYGIVVESAGHEIRNNYVGTDQSGTTTTGSDGSDLGNATGGIKVLANDTEITNNTVSGNGVDGIAVGESGNPADNTSITNNNVGVNESADAVIPNLGDGIDVIEGSGTSIDGNVIGGNESTGIEVTAVNPNVSERTTITNNHIGTNSNGANLGNDHDGIEIEADPSSNLREIEIYDGNVIGHNGADVTTGEGHGIELEGGEHDIAGNYVGTNANGADLGNRDEGIEIDGAENISLGYNITVTSDADEPNVVGYNGGHGIELLEGSSNTVEGNYLGTNASGDDLGNGESGIRIFAGSGNSADDNTVGYFSDESVPNDPSPSNDERGNVIANNGANGVVIEGDGAPVGNAVRGNLISNNGNADNTDIGLDLGGDGVTANDNASDDTDTGPNNLQNFPVIENVSHDDASDEVTITYRVQTATGNAAYPLQIDFYATDSEASGEGKTYIGTQEYTSSDARSSLSNVIDLSQFSNVTKDDHFVATATDADDNTSEFVDSSEPLPVELASFEATPAGESSVELSWTTASEQNNAGFRVQHKPVKASRADASPSPSDTSADDWSTLEQVEGTGTTSQPQSYRFTAENLEVGTHEFRLKQTDLDGTEHVHDPVTVKLQMQEALRLGAPAPNPVQTRARLSFAVKEQAETTLTLYNTLGQQVRTVYRGTPAAGESQTAQIETDGLASGAYFLRLQSGGQLKTQRVTVVR